MTMTSFGNFEITLLEEGFCAKDIVEQKITSSVIRPPPHITFYFYLVIFIYFSLVVMCIACHCQSFVFDDAFVFPLD